MKTRATPRARRFDLDRARLLTIWAAALAIPILTSGLLAPPATAQIVPGGSTVEGKSVGDWGFEWWQWIFGITYPDPWSDTTGEFQNVGQMPPVFFTCGAADAAALVPITRRFTVPADQYILASLSSSGAYYEPGIDPPTLCTLELPAEIDQTVSLWFSLDGVPISQADLFNNHREPSSLNLTSVVATGSPYFPPGIYPGSCSDGYFVMIEPLPPGPHVIECGFTHLNGSLLDHTNEIYVLEDKLDLVETQVDGENGVDGLGMVAVASVSPDGRHVYAAGGSDNAVALFARDEVSGALSFVEHYQDGVDGVNGLGGAGAAVVSPDNAHVYVTSQTDGAIAVFERNVYTGTLTFIDSYHNGMDGVDGLEGVLSIAFSRDGSSVYTSSSPESALTVFARDPASGELTYVESQRDGVAGVDGIGGTRGLAVSPDNAYVYARGETDNAIAYFQRDQGTGALTFVASYSDGVGGVDGLSGAGNPVVSRDGRHLYTGGFLDNAIALFERDEGTGALTFVEIQQDGVDGLDGLGGVIHLAMSPDDIHLYARSFFDNALAVFERDPATGSLTFVDLHRDGTWGVDSLGGGAAVLVSRWGSHVYTGANLDNAVNVFAFVPEPSFDPLLMTGAVFLLTICRKRTGA